MIKTTDKSEDRVPGRHPERDNDYFKKSRIPVDDPNRTTAVTDHHHHQRPHLQPSSKHQQHEFHRHNNHTDHRQPYRCLWEVACPQHIKEEWLTELGQIVCGVITYDELLNLLNYCLYWHPAFSRNEYCYGYSEEERSRCILNPGSLASVLCAIGSQWDVLRLLYDRGPDFGISLLFILELLFQAAFCLKKPPRHVQPGPRQDLSESRRNLSLVVVNAPRLIELLSLHVDCPPLWPNFRVKFGLMIAGLIFHRKLPTASQPRFFQLLYFTCPILRQIAMATYKCGSSHNDAKPEKDDRTKKKNPLPFQKPVLALSDFENSLWHKARTISLGQPDEEAINRIRKRRCPAAVSTRLDAMAFVFERLDHLARALFGSSLCLYGSSATGFATQTSDVDVVLRLSETGINEMLEEAKYWRSHPDGIDLNCFPFMSLNGPSEMVSDWGWLDTKEPAVSASIWAGRKFAWAAYRLFGWRGQCVQSAYVPIVKILACIDSNGLPVEVPNIFTPAAPIDSSLGALLGRMSPSWNFAISEMSVKGGDEHENLNRVLDAMRISSGYHHWSLDSWESQLAKLVAADVVAERQYSSWPPSFSPRVDESLSCFLLRNEFGDENELYHGAADAQLTTLKEARFFHLKLAEEYLRDENMRIQVSSWSDKYEPEKDDPPSQEQITEEPHREEGLQEAQQNYFNCCRTSPALLHPKPSTEMDDGRLSPFDKVSDKEIWLVDCDFSMSRQVGIHNSRLLRAYATCDPRVLALGLLIKHWAAANKIEGAYAGFLSGYQWTLLVIHFLQHYACLTVPEEMQETAAWREYQDAFESAGLTAPNAVPILPNLQLPPTYTVPKPEEKKPLFIKEIEGDVDVFFYEPHRGFNSLLKDENTAGAHKDESGSSLSAVSGGDRVSARKRKRQDPVEKKEWPEDSLLQENPFLYAYSLLRAPFPLQVQEAQKYCRDSMLGDEDKTGAEGQSTREEHKRLWLSRLSTAPRPPSHSMSANGSKSHMPTADKVWDTTRSMIKRLLVQSKTENSQSHGKGSHTNSTSELARESFPSLTPLRDSQFLKDQLINRNNLLVNIPTEDVTLTELLYAFFEYYGFRFNYATEMLDIDKVPSVPAGKKEFFKTSIFTPYLDGIEPPPDPPASNYDNNSTVTGAVACPQIAVEDVDDLELQSSSDSADKELILDIPGADPTVDSAADDQNPLAGNRPDREVIGRGNGPFQFRGRHFLCLRDPFEKMRTIGPPHRCQTRISAAFLGALYLFRDAVSDSQPQRSLPTISRLFSTGVRTKMVSCPIREMLAHYVKHDDMRDCDRYGLSYSKSELFPIGSDMMKMYYENINTINHFGRYRPLIEEVFNASSINSGMRRERNQSKAINNHNAVYGNSNNNHTEKCAVPTVSDEDLYSPQLPAPNGRKSSNGGTNSRRGSQHAVVVPNSKPPVTQAEKLDSAEIRPAKWKYKNFPNPINWLEKQTGIKCRDTYFDPCVNQTMPNNPTGIAHERNMTNREPTTSTGGNPDFKPPPMPNTDSRGAMVAGHEFRKAEDTLRSLNGLCRPPPSDTIQAGNRVVTRTQYSPARQLVDNVESGYQVHPQDLKRHKEKLLLNLIQGNVDPRQLDHELAIANGGGQRLASQPEGSFEPRNNNLPDKFADNVGMVVNSRADAQQQMRKSYPAKYHSPHHHGPVHDKEVDKADEIDLSAGGVNNGTAVVNGTQQSRRNQRPLRRSLASGSSHGRRIKRRGSL